MIKSGSPKNYLTYVVCTTFI